MDRLIEDVLLAAKLEAPEPLLELEMVTVSDWIGSVTPRLKQSVEQSGVTWSEDIQQADALARIDPDRMMQVLGNLTDNAVHAVRNSSAAIITLTLSVNSDQASITIRDNGEGIASADLPYIFDRFYRVDEGRSTAEGGRGLGLSIARAIVDGHGGNIKASSTVAEGTAMVVTVPLIKSVL